MHVKHDHHGVVRACCWAGLPHAALGSCHEAFQLSMRPLPASQPVVRACGGYAGEARLRAAGVLAEAGVAQLLGQAWGGPQVPA